MLRAGMTSSSPPSFAAAEAASGSIELPPLRGGPAICWRGDEWRNANPLFAKVLSDIVVAFPRPLVGCVRLPGISFITDAGDDVQPEAAKNQMFLSTFQRNQFAFVEKERVAAEEFVADSSSLDDESNSCLSRTSVGQLGALLNHHGLETSGIKAALVERLLEFAELSVLAGAAGANPYLQRAAELERAAIRIAKWSSSLSSEQWRRYAANAEFAKLQKDGFRKGFYRRCPDTGDKPLGFYDAYHLFHRMVLRIMFGGGGGPGGILNQDNLRAAAEKLRDPLLASVVYCKVDKNSHMATHYFLTHRGLVRILRQLGYLQDAVVLETFGRAAIAWIRPGRSGEWRSVALHLCNVLIIRMLGPAIHDVNAIRGHAHVAGFIMNQLMDLLSNNEARLLYMEQLSPQESAAMKETAITTRYIESHFSRLSANKGSGEKMTQHEIMGVLVKLDAILVILRKADKGHTTPESKRKRRFVEGADEGWSSGDADDNACYAVEAFMIKHGYSIEVAALLADELKDELDKDFVDDLVKRTKGYVTGRASNRDHNKKFKFETH
jgi:hypothetical protein